MNDFTKQEGKRDICKSHTARSQREPYRMCPSKLSKRELEDLYYNILENNVELKKTINTQRDQIKVLSTRVQRMTVIQKYTPGKENECCANIKNVVNEQKHSMADLKKANERMLERVKVLNMRLCSAKQFLRRNPFMSTSRISKLSIPQTHRQNSYSSIINTKISENNLGSGATSIQNLDKDIELSSRTVVTEIEDQEKKDLKKQCNDNKCQSEMEILKQKIINLEGELSKTQEEYKSRVSQLEVELNGLRVKREHGEASVRDSQQRADQLAASLRIAEANYGELAMELSIEKRKVMELEMRVKTMDMSSTVAKTIEDHLKNANQIKHEIESHQINVLSSPYFSPRDKSYSRLEVPGETRGMSSEATDQTEQNKALTVSDDSGFMPDSPDLGEKVRKKSLNEVLYERINCLQDQLEHLQLMSDKAEKTEESLKNEFDNINFESTSSPRESLVRTSVSGIPVPIPRKKIIEEIAPIQLSQTDELKPKDFESKTRKHEVTNTSQDSLELSDRPSIIMNNNNLEPVKVEKDSPKSTDENAHECSKSEEAQIDNNSKNRIDEAISGTPIKSLEQSQKRRSSETAKKSYDTTSDSNKKGSTDSAPSALARVVGPRLTEKQPDCADPSRLNHALDTPPTNSEAPVKPADNPDPKGPDQLNQVNEEDRKDEGPRRRSATYSKSDEGNKTYSVPPRSPDNTDCEISSLSDLPSEKDGRSPRVLSPGERKITSTLTISYTSPTTTEYGSLSEGELPGLGVGARKLSVGEARVDFHDITPAKNTTATNTNVVGGGQSTLAAIAREVSRCRVLLRGPAARAVPRHTSFPQ